jgi:hypothetical protein
MQSRRMLGVCEERSSEGGGTRWERRERWVSIQTYPSQSIVKTVQPLLSGCPSNVSGATSPTPGYNFRETVLTLRKMALGVEGGLR